MQNRLDSLDATHALMKHIWSSPVVDWMIGHQHTALLGQWQVVL